MGLAFLLAISSNRDTVVNGADLLACVCAILALGLWMLAEVHDVEREGRGGK
jgi:hypothetical protein